MEDKLKFTINSRIEIDTYEGAYISTIQDLVDDAIYINIPVRNGKYLLLNKGDSVEAVFSTKQYIFKFSSIVLGRKIDQIMVIILGKPYNIRVIQRRDYVRVPTLFDINCVQLKDTHSLRNEPLHFFSATGLDLSGGGMRISCRESLKLNDELLITLPVQGDEGLTIKAKVRRLEVSKGKSLNYGISFEDNERKTIEKIVRYVFEIMRSRRNNMGPEGE